MFWKFILTQDYKLFEAYFDIILILFLGQLLTKILNDIYFNKIIGIYS